MKLKKLGVSLIASTLLFPTIANALEYQNIYDQAFPTGKLEIKSIIPPFHSGAETLVMSSFERLNLYDKFPEHIIANNGFYEGDDCTGDTCLSIEINSKESMEAGELYILPVHYIGVNEELYKKIEPFAKNFKGTSQVVEENLFVIKDLEIINYMLVGGYSAVQNSQSTSNAAINYSNDFRKLLANTNIEAKLEVRAGWDEPFTHGVFGDLLLMYEDTIYAMIDQGGVRGTNVIYVPTNTEKTNEAMISAAMKRIEKYIGTGKVKIEVADKIDTVDETGCQFPIANLVDLTTTTGYYYTLTINGEGHNFIISADSEQMQENPTMSTTDLETNVSIKTEESEVPLDSRVESKRHDKDSNEYKEQMKKLSKDEGMVYEIDLYTETLDRYITKLNNGNFEVRVPIDKKYEGKTLIAYYVKEDGTLEPHTVTPKNGYAVFETDHFSTYTIVEVESSEGGTGGSESVPETGDNIIMYVSLMLISGLTSLVILKKQKN